MNNINKPSLDKGASKATDELINSVMGEGLTEALPDYSGKYGDLLRRIDEVIEEVASRKASPNPATVDSRSDARTINSKDSSGNVMRHAYRVLTEDEKLAMQTIKDKGLEFHQYLCSLGSTHELSIAKTKLEEVVMWGTKSLTAEK